MLLMIPILLSMYIRIYRVKRVFELYEKFLDKMAHRSNSIFSTYGMSSQTAALMQTPGISSETNGLRVDTFGLELTNSKENQKDSGRQTMQVKNQTSSGS